MLYGIQLYVKNKSDKVWTYINQKYKIKWCLSILGFHENDSIDGNDHYCKPVDRQFKRRDELMYNLIGKANLNTGI